MLNATFINFVIKINDETPVIFDFLRLYISLPNYFRPNDILKRQRLRKAKAAITNKTNFRGKNNVIKK
ncbi:MAG: hypothetical protein LUM44_05570 [Pyrinomonadaceae bacterium]|nr:hypothetical protein [Pyrinomonadaceae bacterium]